MPTEDPVAVRGHAARGWVLRMETSTEVPSCPRLLSYCAEELSAGEVAGSCGDSSGNCLRRATLEIRDLLLRSNAQSAGGRSDQRRADHPRDLEQVNVAGGRRRGRPRHHQGAVRAAGRIRVASDAGYSGDDRADARAFPRQHNRTIDDQLSHD